MSQENQSVIDMINARHSVRSYLSKNVDKETIKLLLRCAVNAPTAMDEEPCEFLIIQDQAVLKEISDIAKPLLMKTKPTTLNTGRHGSLHVIDPDLNIFYEADTLIVILSKQTGYFVDADCWLAAESLMLAATSMGLGTCVIGCAVEALNLIDLKTRLGIDANVRAIAPIILGFPKGETTHTHRKEPNIVSWVG